MQRRGLQLLLQLLNLLLRLAVAALRLAQHLRRHRALDALGGFLRVRDVQRPDHEVAHHARLLRRQVAHQVANGRRRFLALRLVRRATRQHDIRAADRQIERLLHAGLLDVGNDERGRVVYREP